MPTGSVGFVVKCSSNDVAAKIILVKVASYFYLINFNETGGKVCARPVKDGLNYYHVSLVWHLKHLGVS